ncbi:Hypothetical predicted protein, partial [Marmota monax]
IPPSLPSYPLLPLLPPPSPSPPSLPLLPYGVLPGAQPNTGAAPARERQKQLGVSPPPLGHGRGADGVRSPAFPGPQPLPQPPQPLSPRGRLRRRCSPGSRPRPQPPRTMLPAAARAAPGTFVCGDDSHPSRAVSVR